MPQTSKARPLLGLLLIPIVLLVPYGLEGGNLPSLIGPTELVLVLGGVFGSVLIGCGVAGPFSQFAALLRGEDRDYGLLHDALRITTVAGPMVGFLGVILGLTHVFRHLSDPTRLGAGMAVAFLSLLYGGLIGMVAFAFMAKTASRRATGSGSHLVHPALESGPSPEDTGGQGPETASTSSLIASRVDLSVPGESSQGSPVAGTLLLLFLPCFFFISAGGHFSQLIEPAIMVTVVGLTLCVWLIACGIRAPLSQLFSVYRGRSGDYSTLRKALRLSTISAPFAGLLAAILGVIFVMRNLSDPTSLGMGLAVCMTGLLYGTLLAMLTFALEQHVARQSMDGGPVPWTRGPDLEAAYGVLIAATGSSVLLFVFFLVLYAVSV